MTTLDFSKCKTAEDVKKVYDEETPIPGASYLRKKFCCHPWTEKKDGKLVCKQCGAKNISLYPKTNRGDES